MNEDELLLLDHSTRALLVLFGSGRHTPGAGSAAALSGTLAANLLITVCDITIRKKINELFGWKEVKSRLASNLRKLEGLLQEDSDTFDDVIAHRKLRDEANDEREHERQRRKALDFQRHATEIPIQIGQCCLNLADNGIQLFDYGYQAARGDSTTGIALALAASESCVAIVNLNLRDFQASVWRNNVAKQGLALMAGVSEIRPEVQSRIGSMANEWPNRQRRLF